MPQKLNSTEEFIWVVCSQINQVDFFDKNSGHFKAKQLIHHS